MLLALSVLSAVVLYYVFSWLHFRMKYDIHKIPSPPSYPVVGHLFDFLSMPRLNYNSWTLEWAKKLGYPKVMKRLLPGDTTLFIFDMDFLKTEVLGRDGMPKSRRFYQCMNVAHTGDPEQSVLFTSPYLTPYFRAIRRAAAQAFSSSNMRTTLPSLQKVITDAMARIDKERVEGPVDMQELLVHMTLDVIGYVAFDQNFHGVDKTGRIPSLLEEAFLHFEDEFFKPHLQLYMKLFPNSAPAIKKRTCIESMLEEWKKVTETFMTRPSPGENENSLWASLRKVIDPDTGKPVTASRIFGDVGSLIIAGMDTTGHQMQWIFAILSDHPDVVDKILDELKSHQLYGPNSKDLQFEDLTELKYLNAVIRECMRIVTSTIGGGIREVTKDMTILGYRVPKGTQIVVPSNVYTHMEQWFDDPETFKPERWLGENAKDNLFISFSAGPRDCVGQKLGFFEMQVTLIRMLSKYKFKLSEGTYAEVRAKRSYDAIVVSAEGGLFFDITDRPLE